MRILDSLEWDSDQRIQHDHDRCRFMQKRVLGFESFQWDLCHHRGDIYKEAKYLLGLVLHADLYHLQCDGYGDYRAQCRHSVL